MLSQPVFKNRSMAAALWCQIKVVINGSVRYSQIPGTVYLQEEVCICVRPISANFVFSIVWGRFRPGVSPPLFLLNAVCIFTIIHTEHIVGSTRYS